MVFPLESPLNVLSTVEPYNQVAPFPYKKGFRKGQNHFFERRTLKYELSNVIKCSTVKRLLVVPLAEPLSDVDGTLYQCFPTYLKELKVIPFLEIKNTELSNEPFNPLMR